MSTSTTIAPRRAGSVGSLPRSMVWEPVTGNFDSTAIDQVPRWGHAKAGWRACRSCGRSRRRVARRAVGRGCSGSTTAGPSGPWRHREGRRCALGRRAARRRAYPSSLATRSVIRHLVVGRPAFLEHQDVGADTAARVHDVEGAAPPVHAAVHVEAGDDHARHCTSRLPIHLCPMGDPAAPAWGRRARIGEPPGRRDAVGVERSLRSLHDPRARRIRSPGTLRELTQPLAGRCR